MDLVSILINRKLCSSSLENFIFWCSDPYFGHLFTISQFDGLQEKRCKNKLIKELKDRIKVLT